MKIQDLECFIVGNPPPGFGGRYFFFVKITTDNGITGIGEVYSASFGPKVVQAMCEDVFSRYLIGKSPFDIENFWRRSHSSGFTQRPDTSMMGVVSGLEMAMWDIAGKATNQPVYNLLGGLVNRKIRSYTYLYPRADQDPAAFYNSPEMSAERAIEYANEGFTALKFDPAGAYTAYDPHQPSIEDLDRSEAFCKAIREAVGERADLLFGTHGQFTVSGAIRMARRIEKYDPLWFEEPTPPEMPEEMAKVARASRVPIAAGERLTTKYEFSRVLQQGAANILQPALGRVGGILEAKKIAGMAETFYAQVAPHLYCGPIEAAANIHLAACIPNFLILESIKQFDGFHEQLLNKKIQWEDGYVIPSNEPGLGIELNEEVARAHPYDGTRLHLEMEPQPYTYNHAHFGGG